MHLLALVALQSALVSKIPSGRTKTNTYHSHVVETDACSKQASPEHKLENTHVEA